LIAHTTARLQPASASLLIPTLQAGERFFFNGSQGGFGTAPDRKRSSFGIPLLIATLGRAPRMVWRKKIGEHAEASWGKKEVSTLPHVWCGCQPIEVRMNVGASE
jgi:hypothetical protein